MSIALSRINICKNIKIWNFHLYRTLHDSSLKLFFTVIHHLCNSLNSLLLKKLIWARITNPHHSLFSSGFYQSDWGFLYDQPPLVLETFPLVTDGLVETYFVPGPLGLWHQEVSSCYGDPCHWNPLKIKLKDGSCTQTCAPNKDFFFFSFIFFSIFDNSQQCQYSTNIAAYKKSQDPSTQCGFINMLHLESQGCSQSQTFTAWSMSATLSSLTVQAIGPFLALLIVMILCKSHTLHI